MDYPATLRGLLVLDPPAGSLVGKPFGHPLRHRCGFNPPAGSSVVDIIRTFVARGQSTGQLLTKSRAVVLVAVKNWICRRICVHLRTCT